MFGLLTSLKGLTKLQTYTIDNQVFRLHYKFTVGVLALFSLVLSYNQFFGDPIACTETGSQNAPRDVVETFCWTHYTYSVKEAFDLPVGQHGVIYPGVAQRKDGHEHVQHKYYQWVCFVLALQAVLFYLPRYLWKAMESERVKSLILGLNVPTMEDEVARKKQELLIRYLKTHRGTHLRYTVNYFFCEVLNLLNVVGQMLLLDAFLGGEFSTYGVRVLRYLYEDPRERIDPMIKIFPRMTKCNFTFYGPGGDPTPFSVYCVLPLNIINEKIFIFLWFWFVSLTVVSAVALIYRTVQFLWPTARLLTLKLRCPMSDAGHVEKVTSSLNLGDWFIVYQIAKNVDSLNMAEVLHQYADLLYESKSSWTHLCSEVTTAT